MLVLRTQKALLAMLQLEVLILKFLPIDTLASSTIPLREVSTLNHEGLDHAVECGAFIAKALLASGQGTKVLGGLHEQSAPNQYLTILNAISTYPWHSLAIKTNHNASDLFLAMLNIEVDLVCDFGPFGGLDCLAEVEEGGRADEEESDEETLEVGHCEEFKRHSSGR
jgi:hypothetical protein